MFEIFHPSFGALVGFLCGRPLWSHLDGGAPQTFEGAPAARSVIADLPIGSERQFCQPVPVR